MQIEKKKCKERIAEVEKQFGEKERHLMDKLKRDMN